MQGLDPKLSFNNNPTKEHRASRWHLVPERTTMARLWCGEDLMLQAILAVHWRMAMGHFWKHNKHRHSCKEHLTTRRFCGLHKFCTFCTLCPSTVAPGSQFNDDQYPMTTIRVKGWLETIATTPSLHGSQGVGHRGSPLEKGSETLNVNEPLEAMPSHGHPTSSNKYKTDGSMRPYKDVRT